MSIISAFFLRAKNWQMALLFCVLCVAETVTTISTAALPNGVPKTGPLLWCVSGLVELLFLGWLWSMGSFLSSIVHPALRLNTGFFQFALIYPLLYVPGFIAFFQKPLPLLFAVVIPLHLVAMFCMLYNLYFVSKSLVLAETGKSASFYDYAGPFFLVWFFPVGVWFVQPRINCLFARKVAE
jgi:hypothetical protein